MHPITVYVLFSALWGAGMGVHATIYAPFLLERGMSLSDISAINLIFWLVVSVAELPTGLFADGRGRAWSIRAGCVFSAAGSFGYATANTFWQSVGWEAIMGIGIAFLSGALQAWLTDALIRRGESDRLSRAFGTAAAARGAASIVAGVAGALIGAYDLRLVWVVGGALFVLALLVAYRMSGQGDAPQRMTERQAFTASLQAMRRIPGLPWAMGMSVAFGFVLPFNHFWSPFFLEQVGQSGLAFVWPPLLLGVVIGGLAVRRGGLLVGSDRRGVIVSHVVTGVALMLAAVLPGTALPLMAGMLHNFGRGMFEPLMDAFVQKRVESGYRATYASFQSLVQRGGFAVILGGVVLFTRDLPSDSRTITTAWLWSGGILTVIALLAALRCRSESCRQP